MDSDWQMHQIMWEARWGRGPLLYWWNLCTSGPWERRLWWISFDFNRNPDNSSPDYSHVFHISRLNKKPWPQNMLVSSPFHRMNVWSVCNVCVKGGPVEKLVIRAFSKTLIKCVLLSNGLSLRKTRLALHFNQLFVNPSLLPLRGGKVSQL